MDGYQAAEYQYRLSQILEAQIELEGMKAENQMREMRGESPAYTMKHFEELILKHNIHHNGAVEASIRIRNGG